MLCAALIGLVGCQGFKAVAGDAAGDRGNDRGDDAAIARDGTPRRDARSFDTTDLGSGGQGPGPWGALPSGYCCNSKLDCRHRDCRDIGGDKKCADECLSDDACRGAAHAQHCVGANAPTRGHCEPVASAVACTPADSFSFGPKKLGDCCTPTFDGTNGAECEGNHCGAFGDLANPYICVHACESQSDCAPPFLCRSTGDYSICLNPLQTYSCK